MVPSECSQKNMWIWHLKRPNRSEIKVFSGTEASTTTMMNSLKGGTPHAGHAQDFSLFTGTISRAERQSRCTAAGHVIHSKFVFVLRYCGGHFSSVLLFVKWSGKSPVRWQQRCSAEVRCKRWTAWAAGRTRPWSPCVRRQAKSSSHSMAGPAGGIAIVTRGRSEAV